jgi:hypothetical protein
MKRLADAKHCAREAPYRVASTKLGHSARVIGFRRARDCAEDGHPTVELEGLPWLYSARLSLEVLLGRGGEVEQFSVSISGKERVTSQQWYARIDLDPEQRGRGPCSHPMLHCHVGADPNAQGTQECRVPLPWLAPDEALEWLLATVDPDALEPSSEAEVGGS